MPRVDPVELYKYIQAFQQLNYQSSCDEIRYVIGYLCYDRVVTSDEFLQFASGFRYIDRHTLALLREDSTFLLLAKMLNLIIDAENYLPHLETLDFDLLSPCYEYFVCEMFYCSEIVSVYIERCSLERLWAAGRFELVTLLAQQITSVLNLRYSDKLLEVDAIFASFERKEQFTIEEIYFILQLVKNCLYTDRIVAILNRIRPEQYIQFLDVAISITEVAIPGGTAELLFNMALYTICEQPDSAIGLMQKLLFMKMDFERFESNFGIVVYQLDALSIRTLEAVCYFLCDFLERFIITQPMQVQTLCEDAHIMQKLCKIVLTRSISSDLAFAVCTLIRYLISISTYQLDYFVEQRFDVLDSLYSYSQIRLFEDFDFLYREYCC